MKKIYKFIIPFLIITAVLSVIGIAITGGFKNISLDLIGTVTDGDTYYTETCIDVTSYYAQGYVDSGKDSYGCQLVSKTTVVSQVDMGRNNQNCWANEYYLTNGGSTTYNPCRVVYGIDWIGSCYDISSSTYGGITCTLYGTDIKGGMERILNYCTYDQNDLLVGESFAGGQTINKFSLRYPIKSFCRAHPTIITHDATKTSETSTNVPQDLINGLSVTIATGDTMTVFYIIENNYQLPTICDSSNNLALDVRSNLSICKSTLGFMYVCSEGQFDALRGLCVIQPESKTICNKGVYDTISGMCIYNPPAAPVDCGSNACFYSIDRDICSCYASSEWVCPTGFILSEPTQTQCTAIGGTWQLCPQCPIDKICPTEVCHAQCNIGQKCVWNSPLITVCNNANATIKDNQCLINGTVVIVCPSGTTYRSSDKSCVSVPATTYKCADNSTPTINNITGARECITYSPSVILCQNNNATIMPDGKCYINGTQVIVCPTGSVYTNGRCYLNGTVIITCPNGYNYSDGKCYTTGATVTVCPTGSSYDNLLNKCVFRPTSIIVCADNSTPVVNTNTGQYECLVYATKFISCGNYTDYVYNSYLDKCVPSILMYDQITNKFIEYKEIYTGCKSDADCKLNDGKDYACTAATGYCYTANVKENYNVIIILGSAFIAAILTLLFFV